MLQMIQSLLSPANLRRLHRQLAPVLFLPFLLVTLTGLVYQLGARSDLIPLSERLAGLMMRLHNGAVLGKLRMIYILLLTLGFVGMGGSGLVIFRRFLKVKWSDRSIHNTLTPVLILPFLVTGLTGGLYIFGKRLLGVPDSLGPLLMDLHTGNYLGAVGSLIYVVLLSVGLVVMVMTGLRMTHWFRRRRPTSPPSAD